MTEIKRKVLSLIRELDILFPFTCCRFSHTMTDTISWSCCTEVFVLTSFLPPLQRKTRLCRKGISCDMRDTRRGRGSVDWQELIPRRDPNSRGTEIVMSQRRLPLVCLLEERRRRHCLTRGSSTKARCALTYSHTCTCISYTNV